MFEKGLMKVRRYVLRRGFDSAMATLDDVLAEKEELRIALVRAGYPLPEKSKISQWIKIINAHTEANDE